MKFERLESYSNLAYPIVGLVHYIINFNVVFLITKCFMGVSSFIYHKYKDVSPQIFRADWFAINLTLNVCTGLLINQPWAWIALIVFSTVYGFWIMGRWSVYVEVALSALPTVIALFVYKNTWEAMGIIALFGIALIVRKQDCGEDQSVFHDSWGHSLWHVLTAIGFGLIV